MSAQPDPITVPTEAAASSARRWFWLVIALWVGPYLTIIAAGIVYETFWEEGLGAGSFYLVGWLSAASIPGLLIALWGRSRITAQWPDIAKPRARMIGALVGFVASFLYYAWEFIRTLNYINQNPDVRGVGTGLAAAFIIIPFMNFFVGLIGFALGPLVASLPRLPIALWNSARAKWRILTGIAGVVLIAAGLVYQYDYGVFFPLFRFAAARGSAVAQRELAMLYHFGTGIEQDYGEAVKWYQLAAEQGDVQAQNNLDVMYLRGMGVAENSVEAAKWIKLSAEKGNIEAQSNLGDMYFYGYGVEPDYTEAVKWTRPAAEKGDLQAQNNLGNFYAEGLGGLAMDQTAAVNWWKLAAEQGHAQAQASLGQRYFNGEGIEVDKMRALMWMELALKQGNPQASEYIERVIKPSLTTEQISTAHEMAQRCEASDYRECD